VIEYTYGSSMLLCDCLCIAFGTKGRGGDGLFLNVTEYLNLGQD